MFGKQGVLFEMDRICVEKNGGVQINRKPDGIQ